MRAFYRDCGPTVWPWNLSAANDAACDFAPGVACRLGVEIIGATVDGNGSSDDVPHTKAVRLYSQIGPSIAQHQRREIPCMVWMGRFRWIVVAACI